MVDSEIAEILLTEEQIAERVTQLGVQISADFAGQSLVVVGVLTGAAVFTSDLIRRLTLPLRVEFIRASSYGAGTVSSGEVTLTSSGELDLCSNPVLLVEDIVDTGRTVQVLREHLLAQNPQEVRICTLLDKPSRREVNVPLDYVGFEIPDYFVVGYGLDFNQRYRHLPYVARLHPEAYAD